MRRAAVGVPVATVWSSPSAPADGDAPALGAEPDVPAWTASLGHEQRLSLLGRVVTQALWGDLVLVREEQDGWARTVLPEQPSSLDPRGYPGWIPSAQLAACAPAATAERYVVAVPSVRAGLGAARAPVEVSFGTSVWCPAPAGEEHVWAVTRSGHRLRLPTRALALVPGAGNTPGADDTPGAGHVRGAGDAVRGQALVDCAMSFAGLAYLWGGVSGFGLDCSGLAWSVHRRHGIIVPRDAHDQAEFGQPVSLGALEPGDLVFFAEPPSGHVHHVGMALGDGRMVHAPRTGRPVEVTPLSAEPYADELATARRYR